jgi:hypothetical protein
MRSNRFTKFRKYLVIASRSDRAANIWEWIKINNKYDIKSSKDLAHAYILENPLYYCKGSKPNLWNEKFTTYGFTSTSEKEYSFDSAIIASENIRRVQYETLMSLSYDDVDDLLDVKTFYGNFHNNPFKLFEVETKKKKYWWVALELKS